MRRLLCLTAALLGLATAARGAGPDADTAYALQMPGSFHGGEVVARDGEPWLALVVDEHGAYLEDVVLSVQPVHDALVDAEGEATGLQVGTDGVEAVAFLRGPGLVAGAITGPVATDVPLVAGLELWLDDAQTQFVTLECTTFVPPPSDGSCGVEVSGDVDTSTLVELPAILTSDGVLLIGDDGYVRVLFAGDLDGDHTADLLIDASDHYNLSHLLLFMSGSRTHTSAPVKVAEFRSSGC